MSQSHAPGMPLRNSMSVSKRILSVILTTALDALVGAYLLVLFAALVTGLLGVDPQVVADGLLPGQFQLYLFFLAVVVYAVFDLAIDPTWEPPAEQQQAISDVVTATSGEYTGVIVSVILGTAMTPYKGLVCGTAALAVATLAGVVPLGVAIWALILIPVGEQVLLKIRGRGPLFYVSFVLLLTMLPLLFVATTVTYVLRRTPHAAYQSFALSISIFTQVLESGPKSATLSERIGRSLKRRRLG